MASVLSKVASQFDEQTCGLRLVAHGRDLELRGERVARIQRRHRLLTAARAIALLRSRQRASALEYGRSRPDAAPPRAARHRTRARKSPALRAASTRAPRHTHPCTTGRCPSAMPGAHRRPIVRCTGRAEPLMHVEQRCAGPARSLAQLSGRAVIASTSASMLRQHAHVAIGVERAHQHTAIECCPALLELRRAARQSTERAGPRARRQSASPMPQENAVAPEGKKLSACCKL